MTKGKIPTALMRQIIEGKVNQKINEYQACMLRALLAVKEDDLPMFKKVITKSEEIDIELKKEITSFYNFVGVDPNKEMDFSLISIDAAENN